MTVKVLHNSWGGYGKLGGVSKICRLRQPTYLFSVECLRQVNSMLGILSLLLFGDLGLAFRQLSVESIQISLQHALADIAGNSETAPLPVIQHS